MISFENYIEKLKKAFQYPLPGIDAQYKMAPGGRLDFIVEGTLVKAAVLLLIYSLDNKPHLVFMRRPEYDGSHSGQISFPGGKFEPTDKDFSYTAIRETIEELGDRLENIEIIGKLTPLVIPVSKYEVHPYVGTINYKPNWHIDPNEVAYIIEVSIDDLLKPENKAVEILSIHGVDRKVPFYKVGDEKIWGATAMILFEFETISQSCC